MAATVDSPPATGAGAWRELLAAPGVRRIVAAGLLGRLPLGMNSIGIVLLLRAQGEGYGIAGLVAAAYSIASAVSAPVVGRLIDRAGPTRVLLPLALGFPAALGGLIALAVAGAGLAGLLACAALAGLLLPPLGAAIRSLWPVLVPRPELRGTAYAMEASLQEIFFLVGPLLVALIGALASPAAALGVSAAAGGIGTLLFAVTPAARMGQAEPRAAGQRGGALASSGVRTVALASMAMGVAFGAIEVSMPAFGEAHGSRAGGAATLASISLGSLVGGLWLGGRPAAPDLLRRYRLALVAFAGGLALPLLAGSIGAMAFLVFFSGLAIAPAFACAYGLLDDAAIPGTTTEAFAWLSTAIVLGLAAGTAGGGGIIEAVGTDGSLGLGVAAGVAALACVVIGRRTLEPRAARDVT